MHWQALRGEDQGDLPEDDLDDVDFELDWADLLAEDDTAQPVEEEQPRTRAQHRRRARELESTARIRDRHVPAAALWLHAPAGYPENFLSARRLDPVKPRCMPDVSS